MARAVTLDGMIRQVRRVRGGLMGAIAREAAREIARENARHLRAGRAPDGTPWPPRKRDGGRALPDAAGQVRVDAIGNTILMRLRGREYVLHHFGRANTAPVRQMIPYESDPLPPSYEAAIKRAIARVSRRYGVA